MLSTTAINHHTSAALQAGLVGNDVVPETGMFDFMNYLLGLQGSPQDQPTDTEAGIPFALNSGKKTEGDQALLSIFDKKSSPLLDSLTLSQAAGPGQVNPLLAQGVEKPSNETLNQKPVELEKNPFASDQTALMHFKNAHAEKITDDSANKEVSALEPTDDLKPKAFEKMQKDNALQRYAATAGENSKETVNSNQTNHTITYSQNAQKSSQEVTKQGNTQQIVSHSEPLKGEVDNVGESKKRSSKDDTFSALALGVHDKANVGTPKEVASANAKPEIQRATLPELFDKVQSMVHHGNGKMTVALNPPSLGHVEIQVTARGRMVEIQMKSESALAKSAIESSLSDLKSSMQAQDLHLSKLEVQVSREVDRNFGTGQFTTMSGHDNSFQQSQRFSHDAPQENPWRESGVRAVSGVKANSNLSSASAVAAQTRAFGIGSGAGRVDIRI